MKLGLRIWIFIIALIFSIIAIKPGFGNKGVLITSIDINSTFQKGGLSTKEIIKQINNYKINNKEDYSRAISELFKDGKEKRIDIITNEGEYTFFTNDTPDMAVINVPRTNIKTGLDLRGGARALVRPDQKITDDDLNDLVEISRNRFNVYGLSDVNIKGVNDLEGNKFLLIEIAGATPKDLENLIAQQGKFEAKIANKTVFVGGKNRDIRDVCRNDARCASITGCFPNGNEMACNFAFTIYLSEEAAKKHADMTKELGLDDSGQYLSEKLYLYVDGKEVDSLLISAGLRGQETTQISIQGSGSGKTRQEAIENARNEMKRLQTILLTGSLPYKLNIERLDTISPALGEDFIKAILTAGLFSILLVSVIIFSRYKKIKISFLLLLTSFSELIIILGVASFIKWNLDLPSIAGILATIGTGVDQQIVIIDENEKNKRITVKERMKRALFVIVTAYLTSLVSLLPLYWAGAGLFKGFAFTTIIGITVGVFITRPAFAELVKRISE